MQCKHGLSSPKSLAVAEENAYLPRTLHRSICKRSSPWSLGSSAPWTPSSPRSRASWSGCRPRRCVSTCST